MRTCLALVFSLVLLAPVHAADAPKLADNFPPPESKGGWRTLLPEKGEPTDKDKAKIREQTGVDWDKLKLAWEHNAGAPGATGLLVIRKGQIVGEWYRDCKRDTPFNIYSSSKAYTSVGFGLILDDSEKGMKDWWELMRDRETRMDKPMKPQVVAAELGRRLPDNAIVSCDSGTIATWWARHIPVKRGQMHSISGTLATMACGLPYTIAAQVAYPDRPCIGFVGDGGFSMLMCEFITAVKYKLPIKIVIIKNNSLGQIKWEQMVFLGNPEFGCDLQPIDFAAFAEACGGKGFTIENPKKCGAVLDDFLSVKGPALVQAVVDPFEPPMPPKATLKQTVKLGEALARGEKDAGKVVKTVLEDKVKEMI